MLTVDESGGGSLTIDLSPSQDFSNDVFKTISDGDGGTDISIGQGYVLSALTIPNVTTSSFEDGGQFIYGINDSDTIVGEYNTSKNLGGGFIYENNVFMDASDPNNTTFIGAGTGLGLKGINDLGVAVGTYVENTAENISKGDISFGVHYGYIFDNGTYSTLSDPNSPTGTNINFEGRGTYANSINNNGEIVGYYTDVYQQQHGFIYENGTYTTFDYGSDCELLGVNDEGDLIGTSFQGSQLIGFEYSGGKFTQLPFIPTGINNNGVIVGNVSGYGYSDGFIYKDGVTTQYTADGAAYTELDGINNNGEIVGAYGSGYPFTAFTLKPA